MNGDKMNNQDGFRGELEQLHRDFAQWRQQNGQRRVKIPEHLWQDAAVLARSHGVTKVATTLRLDYHKLKELAGVTVHHKQVQRSELSFVELMMPGPGMAAERVIELINRKGCRMTIRLSQHCVRDLVDLTEVFLR